MGLYPSSLLALMPWLLTTLTSSATTTTATTRSSSNAISELVPLTTTTSRRSGKPNIIVWNILFSSIARVDDSDNSDDSDDDVTTTNGNNFNSNRIVPLTPADADYDNVSILLHHAANQVPRGGGGEDTIIGLDDDDNDDDDDDNDISTIEDDSECKSFDYGIRGINKINRRKRRRNPIRRIGKKLTPLFLRARNLAGRSAAKKLQRHRRDDDEDEYDEDEVTAAYDGAFEELDRIFEKNATTTTTTTTTATATTAETNEIDEEGSLREQRPEGASSDEEMDDLTTKTARPPLRRAASLLKWRKQNSLRDWLNEMEFKFCSAETAKALGTIRNIIDTFSDYGVVDLFGMYGRKDVILSIVALSRLQHVLDSDTRNDTNDSKAGNNRNGNGNDINNDEQSNNNNTATINAQLLSDLAHYCTFANAAYGWKGVAFCGRWHFLGGNNRVLMRSTGIDRRDILGFNWHSKVNRPAYYIARDTNRKAIVLSIRGSLSPRDILTDLCASSENFIVEDDPTNYIGSIGEEEEDIGSTTKPNNTNDNDVGSAVSATTPITIPTTPPPLMVGRAHKGMVDAARSVARMTGKKITDELNAHPDYSLVIVGHSLGGGVAAVLYYMWQRRFSNRGIRSFGYGSPCVFPLNITRDGGVFERNESSNSDITTVMGTGDPFATISLGHIADVTKALSKLCQDRGLRKEILRRTGVVSGLSSLMDKRKDNRMTREDYEWCNNAMTFLRKQMDSEKLYPPGKIYHVSGPLLDFQQNLDNSRYMNNNDGKRRETGSRVGGGGDAATTTTTAMLKSVDATMFNELKLHARMLDVSLHIPMRYEMLLRRLAAPSEVF